MRERKEQELFEKAKDLTAKMTLEEKISMIHGAQLFQTAGVERLGIPPLKMSDGPMGVRQEFHASEWLAVGYSDDYVTYLPCNSALASTWNRKLAYETGSILGAEARGRGKDIILAPGINIKRSPLCGRNFEYFSEDPYLTGELAVPFIRGVQNWDVAACVKHFAVNNQETNRLWADVQIDENVLREIYLPAFYDAIKKAEAYSVMGAYNLVRGEHCCQSGYLLNDILRKEWEYEGVVISDWGAVHDTELAACSQLDIEMSVTDDFDRYFMAEPLKEEIESGKIRESVVDEKIIRILVLMMKLHMLDGERKAGTYNAPAHRKGALDTARESVVLLKNEKNLLPLDPGRVKKVLVVGENAERTHAGGGGSAEIKALYEITPLLGIRMLLGGNTQVDYLQGYCRDEEQEESATNWQETSLEDGGGKIYHTDENEDMRARRAALREEAMTAAADYEYIVFIGGLNHNFDSEGNDRESMELPYEQDELIQGLLKINPKTIITFVGGSPVEMGRWIDRAQAVVWSWYAGMEGGRAFAEILFGEINPSGKLPETFYKTHMDCSAHAIGEFPGGKQVYYKEGVFVGYRYNDTFEIAPQFCFGHGLSYTEFQYSDPSVCEKDGKFYVKCQVENTGKQEGKEVVQIYLAPKKRTEHEPVQQLKGFEKTELLKPGEKQAVCIRVDGWREDLEIRIGSSSRDIRLKL